MRFTFSYEADQYVMLYITAISTILLAQMSVECSFTMSGL